jgi:predicted phage tail protein
MARILRNTVYLQSNGRDPAQTAMEDSLHFDIHVQQRVRSTRRTRASHRTDERPELLAAEPINVYHWAAVAFVTALMCAVMAWAAGTPALSRAAGVTSFVFAAFGSALVLGGMLRTLHTRRNASAS